jgi:hypothetical protein
MADAQRKKQQHGKWHFHSKRLEKPRVLLAHSHTQPGMSLSQLLLET